MADCTGCSLLCDDIVVEVNGDGHGLKETTNLCRKGHGYYESLFEDRLTPTINGEGVDFETAISQAAELLKGADRPLLFGWGNSTLEAQKLGINLAKKLGASIDDSSSFGTGILMEKVLREQLPTCTFDDVRNFADVSIYWGDDPSSSHPRHMSRFSYFPRGEKRQRGYEEDRTALVIDVRTSPTAVIAANGFIKIPPEGDVELIEAFMAALSGKIPKVNDKKKILNLGTTLKKAKYGVVFAGMGLAHSLKNDVEPFVSLIDKLNQVSSYKVIPTTSEYNSRGFNQALLEETDHINQVSFKDGVSSGPEFSLLGSIDDCDAMMVIGSDPVATLPAAISKKISKIPLVAIGPHRNLTTDMAKLTIPSAVSGLESGGSALRMDGVKVEFDPVIKSDYQSDAEILARIMGVL